MTSPSERTELADVGADGLSAGLFDRQASSRRVVSRLEFHPLPLLEMETEPRAEAQNAEARLKEEVAALDLRLKTQEQQTADRLESARNEGRLEARREWGQELEQRIEDERKRIVQCSEQFGRQRSMYFAAVESEVVKLALAIAARVLHREAKLDPLLLAAAVRVALEKVEQSSETVLRVPAEDAQQWRELFASEDSRVQVIEDGKLSAGDCVLDTHVGTVELGVSAQLSEIERGFFDLLQQRPAR